MDEPSNNEKPEGRELDALPPPIFPPGSSYRRPRWSQPPAGRRATPVRQQERSGLQADADTSGIPVDAFISPDEPFHHRPTAADSLDAAEEVIVTGMGDDPHLDDPPVPAQYPADPHLRRLIEMVSTLSRALHDRGEAGLRTTEGMSRFEATLRAYCVGWLAARRESA